MSGRGLSVRRFLSWSSLACVVVGAGAAASGPAINANFPDPCLARDEDGRFYAFATQSKDINIQVASSPDFETWELHEGLDALPELPSWAKDAPKAEVWAPDVNALPSGDGWVMYFAALSKSNAGRHCIGAATSTDNITGPYQPVAEPVVCQMSGGGSIDPNLFHDPVNGLYYLVYKVDGNSLGHGGACGNTVAPVAPTPIFAQQMSSDDLVTPVGEPVFLINNLDYGGFEYDGPNTERPSLTFRDGTYYLLYNARCYASLEYRIDYVACVAGVDTDSGLAGCNWGKLKAAQEQQQQGQTLLQTGDQVNGTVLHAPGSIDTDGDSNRVIFHADTDLAWFDDQRGDVQRVRAMYAAYVEYDSCEGSMRVTELASTV